MGLICEVVFFDLVILVDYKGDGFLLSFELENFDFVIYVKL